MRSFDPSREVMLARPDVPISMQFHPHLPDTMLVLYKEDHKGAYNGELRSINCING